MAVRAKLASAVLAWFLTTAWMPAETLPTQTLAIVTSFEHAPSPQLEKAMHREVGSLFVLGRLVIVWEDLAEAAGTSVHDRIVVARFRGGCNTESRVRATNDAPPLAYTHVTDGDILPFVEVDCERVQRCAARVVKSYYGTEAERALGRALGRVLSHEIYHVLARTMAHGSRGLAKPQLTPRELVAEGFGFDELDLARMRESLFDRQLASATSSRREP